MQSFWRKLVDNKNENYGNHGKIYQNDKLKFVNHIDISNEREAYVKSLKKQFSPSFMDLTAIRIDRNTAKIIPSQDTPGEHYLMYAQPT